MGNNPPDDSAPPLLPGWGAWYLLVLLVLFALVLAFTILTQVYR